MLIRRQYVRFATPVQIRLIRLRYINRILIPLVNGRADLGMYFHVSPRLPDEERLTLVGFFHQQIAMEVASGNEAQTVLASQNPEGDALPLIFDNGVLAQGAGDPTDWAWILGKVQALRDLKNHIFRRSLTDQCLKLFQ